MQTLPQPELSVIMEAVNRLRNLCQSALQRQEDPQKRYERF